MPAKRPADLPGRRRRMSRPHGQGYEQRFGFFVYFGNAKYWFRRVGRHPVFDQLQSQAVALAADSGVEEAKSITTQRDWDPMKFIDLCQQSIGRQSAAEAMCMRIQRAEWDLLFADCYNAAVGTA